MNILKISQELDLIAKELETTKKAEVSLDIGSVKALIDKAVFSLDREKPEAALKLLREAQKDLAKMKTSKSLSGHTFDEGDQVSYKGLLGGIIEHGGYKGGDSFYNVRLDIGKTVMVEKTSLRLIQKHFYKELMW